MADPCLRSTRAPNGGCALTNDAQLSGPTNKPVKRPVSGGTGAEAGWFVLAAVGLVALELGALQAGIALTRPLWLDEVHTYLLAATQSLPESMRSLASGADFSPPTVFLLYRVVGHLAGGLSELTMRLVAVVSVVGALATTYVLLREQFSRVPAAAGTLAVWAHPVVVYAAFDARFYGPWLLATGCMLVALRRAVVNRPTGLSRAALAAAAVALCTVHYFGILSWAAAVALIVVRAPGGRRDTIRRLLPALAGPLALAACIPFFLEQKEALTVPTWNRPQSLAGLLRLLAVLVLEPATVVALAFWASVRVLRLRVRLDLPDREATGLSLGPQLLLAQGLVPVALAVFSLVVQPATEPRYWITGTFVGAPLVAAAASRSGRGLGAIIAIVALLCSMLTLYGQRLSFAAYAERVTEDMRATSRLADEGTLVVTRRRHELYPLLVERPDLRAKVALLDYSAIDPNDDFAAIERDVARVHLSRFGFPAIVEPRDLAAVRSFYLVEFPATRRPTANEFPHHVIEQVSPRLFRLERR